MPSLSHQMESLERLERAVWASEGNGVIGPDRLRQASFQEELPEGRDGEIFTRRFNGVAEKQESRGVICDCQRGKRRNAGSQPSSCRAFAVETKVLSSATL